jgi:hypothetical protein
VNIVDVLAPWFAQTATVETGSGPTAAPSSFSVQSYGSPAKVRCRWTNGDASAYTRIYKESGVCGGIASLVDTVNPGQTVVELSITWTPQNGYHATHYKNGQESAESNCAQSGDLL